MKTITKISRVLLGITIVLLAAWVLPWGLNFFLTVPNSNSFTLYSPVKGDFLIRTDFDDDKSHMDTKGNYYSQDQADELLPFFYARQLMADGKFPTQIAGQPVSYKDAQTGTFYFQHSPRDINKPALGIHQLLESRSGRVNLESSTDVFRFTDQGIEFIDIATNSLLADKSKRFTDMLESKGFAFPSKTLHGIPSTRKDYDEGYLVVDQNNQLFHMKQVKGRPYVRVIDVPQGAMLKNVFITEFRDKYTLGFASDENNNFYVITRSDYKFHPIDIRNFNPNEASLFVMGTPMFWTIRVTNADGITYYAVANDTFDVVDKYTVPMPEETLTYKAKDFLASWALHFTSGQDQFVFPRWGY